MKNTFFVTCLSMMLMTTVAHADCTDAEYAAAEAYAQARKAYKSEDFESCYSYSKKAQSAASDAESYAADCRCEDAEMSAADAYSYARKAYRSEDFEECLRFARKAYNAASDAESYASDCN